MVIGGLQKFSLLDYPVHLSAVVFTKGCNFRCQFCYNPMLVWPTHVEGKFANNVSSGDDEKINKGHPLIEEDDLFDFLRRRAGRLDAVVISGGEPTIHNDLPKFIAKIKKYGYKAKLDTNGTNPKMLKKIIDSNLIDYIAMDIKAAPSKYEQATGIRPDLKSVKKSIKIIMKSGLPYEFRTTAVPKLLEAADIAEIGKLIKGADKWFLQGFKSDTALVNPSLEGKKAYSVKEMERMKKIAAKHVKFCGVR